MKEEALKLLRLGLSVFPVSNETKTPLVEWKSLQEQLPSIDDVTKWFSVNNRSIGVATGKTSGVFMVDFDFTKHPKSRQFYTSKVWPLTWKEQTKSGGIHLYFKWASELDSLRTNTASVVHEGVDTKGTGGY